MKRPLERLLGELRVCAPSDRINLREPILDHGVDVVPALRGLVRTDPDLGPSIVSWLEVLARRDPGARGSVLTALRAIVAEDHADAGRYAARALERLGVVHPALQRPRLTRLATPSGGTEWPGFQAHEFGRNAGTSWRSADGRTSLAPVLTRVLQELDPGFLSYGVERSPEIHFALARRYKGTKEAGITASKLVVYAHGPTDERPDSPAEVVAGYYVEKGDGRPPYGSADAAASWDWPLFLAALARRPFQDALTEVMERHGLRIGDYSFGRFPPSFGWVARVEDGDPVGRNAGDLPIMRGWPEIHAWLTSVPADTWLDLHLWRTWPAAEAAAGGQPFALRELAPVLTDLAELYLDVVGQGWRSPRPRVVEAGARPRRPVPARADGGRQPADRGSCRAGER